MSPARRTKRGGSAESPDAELPRGFEGRAVLQQLLDRSGTLADVEDVVGAFQQAVKDEVPASIVIQALWEDEPRFENPEQARALFGNLLGLYDLVAQGELPDLSVDARPKKVKREKASPPGHFDADGPTQDFVEAAWRYLDDHPREYERAQHAFENRQDALITWLDAAGLGDDGFALARNTLFEIFAMLEQGGMRVASIAEEDIPTKPSTPLPDALAEWIDEAVFEAEQHETAPLSPSESKQARGLITRAAFALWATP